MMINDWLTPNPDVGAPTKSLGYRLTNLYLTYSVAVKIELNKLPSMNGGGTSSKLRQVQVWWVNSKYCWGMPTTVDGYLSVLMDVSPFLLNLQGDLTHRNSLESVKWFPGKMPLESIRGHLWCWKSWSLGHAHVAPPPPAERPMPSRSRIGAPQDGGAPERDHTDGPGTWAPGSAWIKNCQGKGLIYHQLHGDFMGSVL